MIAALGICYCCYEKDALQCAEYANVIVHFDFDAARNVQQRPFADIAMTVAVAQL